MNSSNLVICLGYSYNIFNLGAIFASFTHSDLIGCLKCISNAGLGQYRCGGTGISATLLLECGYRGTFIPPELPTSGAFVLKTALVLDFYPNGGLVQGSVLRLADQAGSFSGGTYHSWIAHFFIVGDGPT